LTTDDLYNEKEVKAVRMYYGSGAVAYTASQWRHYALGGLAGSRWTRHCCICSSERRVDVMAAVLKVWRQIRNR